ncbi:MAG TPA: hypothetical protein VEX86_00165 [Longimicrobium sp.]|nr:hypothetical protein [Longimicrobium sp.]
MQQADSTPSVHGSPSTGLEPAAGGKACPITPQGEVRTYAPFGLLHLPATADADVVETIGRSWATGQEQRGRTGLAA